MATITVRLDVIKDNNRTFVIPSVEDIDYDEKIMSNRKREVEKQVTREEIELEDLTKEIAEMEDGQAKNQKIADQDLLIADLSLHRESLAQLKALVANYEGIRTARQTLLAHSETINLEFTEPLWEDIAGLEDRYRTLVEKTSTYVTDRVAVQNALLRKCCPQALKMAPAIADRMFSILRRYTEVNTTDLPFLF
jgi:hypothetical protein